MPAPVPVKAYLEALLSLDGIPYVWGGKDPGKDGGLDCSGAVCYALLLAGGPDLRQTHNAARLYCETLHADGPQVVQGCLSFYGPPTGHATHVMTVTAPLPAKAGIIVPEPTLSVYGATGGNSSTLTPELAKKIGAKVQHRPSLRYRPDLLKVGTWIRLTY